jgi:hypothetical protein
VGWRGVWCGKVERWVLGRWWNDGRWGLGMDGVLAFGGQDKLSFSSVNQVVIDATNCCHSIHFASPKPAKASFLFIKFK